jgi:ribosomal protein L30/L7E
MAQRIRLEKFDQLEGRTVVVERTGGESGRTQRQRETIRGLGLGGVGSRSEIRCTRAAYGMLLKVSHMIRVVLK